jgi:tetratricopeptide (TPR) repeat protein/ferredoxin
VAAFTFFVCGFVVVFVLGSKGYCSYGCPYGAAFGLADRLAPIRVRVTDACRECATCTAVCTSNVRVHEEVRDRGMVVDPGCMKCLDCVANCPNGALYVGAGRPAMGRGRGSRRGGILTWPEEVLAGLVFVGGFVVFRGLYGVVPFLLALGLAAILAGLVVTAWRVVRRRDAWLGPLRLKAGGRIRPLGTAFLALMFPVLLVWAHSAGVRVLEWRGRALFETIAGLRHASLAIGTDRATLSEGDRQRLERARRVERWRMRLSPVTSSDGELRMAWLAFLTDDRGSAELHVDRALVRRPTDARAHLLAARMLVGDGRLEEAASAYDRVVELDPSNPAGYLGLGVVLGQSGRIEEALDVFARGLSTVPDSVDLRYNRGLSLAYLGDIDGAITDFERAVAADSGHLPARENLAGMLAAAGRFDEAIPVFEEAVRRSPNDPQLRIMAARACLGAGRRDCASGHIEAAIRLDPTLADLRRLLD